MIDIKYGSQSLALPESSTDKVIKLETAKKYLTDNLYIDVAIGSATTPATTITAAPTLTLDTTTGIITGNVSKTQSITPTVVAGYITNGTAGTITVSGNDTYQVPLYDETAVINETIATNPSFYDGSYTYVTG